MMMDVEKVLSETTSIDNEVIFRSVVAIDRPDATVFYCDDSSVARKQIERTLTAMGIKGVSAVNGRRMWEEMEKMAAYAQSVGRPLSSIVNLILTDIEMPEMDGYILTKKVKSDPRFNGIPVIMHSSLSGMSNQKLGLSVGVDEYVPKFEPQRLSETLARRLGVENTAPKAISA
jgi:two-component system chemotaxis response regulator CheV